MQRPTPAPPLERAAKALIKATADLGQAQRDLERAKETLLSRSDDLARAERAMREAVKGEPAPGYLTILDAGRRSFVISYDPAGGFEIHEAHTVADR